jgi:hypothetical protein
MAKRVVYWHIDDIDIAEPKEALAMLDNRMQDLILSLKAAPAQ